MTHVRTYYLLLLLSFTSAAAAQANDPAGKPLPLVPQAQTTSEHPPTIAQVVDFQIDEIETQLLRVVEAMPDDKFDYTPTQLNTKDSRDPIRSFASQVKHIATVNYVCWTALTHDPMPAEVKGSSGPDGIKTKADIIKFLKDSFALGHKAAATLTSQNAVEEVPFRQNKAPRLYLATFAVQHAYDHYGQLALFLRMNSITPPGSRAPH